MLRIIFAISVSYLIGSIPTAYLFGRILKGIDIRKFGSGNVGATNALRVLGRPAGIAVLILDVIKGLLPLIFFKGNDLVFLVLGVSCIAGHNWTVFLNFKGGKGVATSLGVLIGLALKIKGLALILGLVVLVWLVSFIFWRIVSLSSVLAGIAFPLLVIAFHHSLSLILFSLLISLFLLLRHLPNLKRLLQGKESRLKL